VNTQHNGHNGDRISSATLGEGANENLTKSQQYIQKRNQIRYANANHTASASHITSTNNTYTGTSNIFANNAQTIQNVLLGSNSQNQRNNPFGG